MDKLVVEGQNPLSGVVEVSRAKNAILPILAGCLLSSDKVSLKSVPELRDIQTMINLLQELGVDTRYTQGQTLELTCSESSSCVAPYEMVKTMRASICVLGPLLGRWKKAKVSLPGGCAIGTRPIDLHLKNLEKMKATITIENGYVCAETKGLEGTHLTLDFPSVGATENLMMAAVLAKGETIIENAALEPEIDDLANFLNHLGAKIEGAGSRKIHVQGVQTLGGGEYKAIGDRIEAGTYVMAALMTKSQLRIEGFNPQHLTFVFEQLQDMGAQFSLDASGVELKPSQLKPFHLETAPYPGFPTDLQAQMMALALTIDGASTIVENIFENRFMHVPELMRMGADIKLKAKSAFINGGKPLTGAPVMCTDLRASAALVLASLVASGETHIRRIYHLERGYEKIDQKLKNIGARISREKQ